MDRRARRFQAGSDDFCNGFEAKHYGKGAKNEASNLQVLLVGEQIDLSACCEKKQ
jgi:hypothetical protein